MLRNALGGVLMVPALFGEYYLLVDLLSVQSVFSTPLVWFLIHLVLVSVAALGASLISMNLTSAKPLGIFCLCLALGLGIPFMGALGAAGALLIGIYVSNSRHHGNIYWQFTENAELPFTTPSGRPVSKYDSRGFVEQLMYSTDANDLYKKVLAARNIRAALSIGMLKKAVQHPDEKIRLTAYQTLDQKVTHLNREIQRLEDDALKMQGEEKSNTWLQIASNYWELLTLEKDEPIARKQLLEKARVAAVKSIQILPTNRNSHFTLGRVVLMQGDTEMAVSSFNQSMQLGMPEDKIKPYLAEAAFEKREYRRVANLLDSMDDSFKLYPPLSHVANYWK